MSSRRRSGIEGWKATGPCRKFAVSFLSTLLAFSAACSFSDQSQTKVYQGEGIIVALDPDQNSVSIKHQEIRGYMAAMTMPFKVKPPVSLSGFSRNDRVRFELVVTPEESWIGKLEYTGHIEEVAPAGTGPNAPEPVPLSEGSMFPNFTFTDQSGHKWSLKQARGKAVALTFVFTRCPLPEFCPRFSRNFADVQRQLVSKLAGRFQLVSITLDPAYDSPEVLTKYANTYGADFAHWTFLTGREEAIRDVTSLCGVRFWREEGSVTHSAATAIIGPGGKLYKLHRGNDVTPEQIASDLESALAMKGSK